MASRRSKKPQRSRPQPPAGPWTPEANQGSDFVDVIPRNPDLAWVMWEITEKSYLRALEQLERLGTDPSLVLRVRSMETIPGAPPRIKTLNLPVDHWIGERTVPLGTHGAKHQCALGLMTNPDEKGNGFFSAIVESAPFHAPRRTPGTAPSLWTDAPQEDTP